MSNVFLEAYGVRPRGRARQWFGGAKRMTSDIWGDVRQSLKDKVGHNNYVTWIAPLRFSDLTDGILTFEVASNFMGNWVDRYFRDAIVSEVAAAGHDVRRLAFSVSKPETEQFAAPETGAAPEAPKPAAPERDAFIVESARLDPNFTFDNFVVGKPNELAHAAGRRVAEGAAVAFNPLYLYGGVGLGKTHLLQAIAWEIHIRDPETRVLFLTAEKFMYRFVQALRDKKMMDFKEAFRSVDVLIVDDIQFFAGKDSTQEEFFHTFNALVEQRKQIILSSEKPPTDIDGMEQRIVSRMQSGLVVDFHPTSYELRLGILQKKVEMHGPNNPGVRIEDGVLELLAHRVTTNLRELEGALTRLYAFGSLVNRDIDIETAEECLRDLLRANDRKTSVDEIQRKVADHYNIRLSDLMGQKRNRVYARPRQVAMYLAKELTERSLPDIGQRFGGRDHTTIMHGIKRIEALRESDSQIAEDLELLRRALRSV